jgi:hypothetical protein
MKIEDLITLGSLVSDLLVVAASSPLGREQAKSSFTRSPDATVRKGVDEAHPLIVTRSSPASITLRICE